MKKIAVIIAAALLIAPLRIPEVSAVDEFSVSAKAAVVISR